VHELVNIHFCVFYGFQFQCCGINGISDWTIHSKNQTRFFGKIPKTCCAPEMRVNETAITSDSEKEFIFEFCPDDATASYDYGCGDKMSIYSVSRKIKR